MASTNNILNGTSTGSFTRSSGTRTNATRTTTLSSATTPTKIDVTVGDSDDSNTEIVEGLTRGQFVITKTIAVGTTQTTAPNILSSLGPQRGGGGAGRTPGTGGFRGN